MSSGRAFDYAVVFIVAGLGYLITGPLLGWIFLIVGVCFLVLWNRKRPAPPERYAPIWPSDAEVPSSSAVIQLIREAYKQRREQ